MNLVKRSSEVDEMKNDEKDEQDLNLDILDDGDDTLMKQDPMLSSPNFQTFSSSSSSNSSR